jgi:hypothetical protein
VSSGLLVLVLVAALIQLISSGCTGGASTFTCIPGYGHCICEFLLVSACSQCLARTFIINSLAILSPTGLFLLKVQYQSSIVQFIWLLSSIHAPQLPSSPALPTHSWHQTFERFSHTVPSDQAPWRNFPLFIRHVDSLHLIRRTRPSSFILLPCRLN